MHFTCLTSFNLSSCSGRLSSFYRREWGRVMVCTLSQVTERVRGRARIWSLEAKPAISPFVLHGLLGGWTWDGIALDAKRLNRLLDSTPVYNISWAKSPPLTTFSLCTGWTDLFSPPPCSLPCFHWAKHKRPNSYSLHLLSLYRVSTLGLFFLFLLLSPFPPHFYVPGTPLPSHFLPIIKTEKGWSPRSFLYCGQ